MKNSLKWKKIISAMLIALFVLVGTKVYAADSFYTTLKVDHTQAKRKDTIIVTIGLDRLEIESGDKGIGAYTASLEFDQEVLEYVSSTGTEKWERPFYKEGLLTGNTADGEVVKETQSIGTLTFKVKDNAKLGETTIKLTNFSGSTAGPDIEAKSDEVVLITILADVNDDQGGNGNNGDNNNGGDSNDTNNGSTNNGSNGGNGSSSNNNSNGIVTPTTNTTKTDNTIVDHNKLPQTGASDIIIFITIGVCTIVASVFFVKLRSIKK